jgi:hypothetical protein
MKDNPHFLCGLSSFKWDVLHNPKPELEAFQRFIYPQANPAKTLGKSQMSIYLSTGYPQANT